MNKDEEEKENALEDDTLDGENDVDTSEENDEDGESEEEAKQREYQEKLDEEDEEEIENRRKTREDIKRKDEDEEEKPKEDKEDKEDILDKLDKKADEVKNDSENSSSDSETSESDSEKSNEDKKESDSQKSEKDKKEDTSKKNNTDEESRRPKRSEQTDPKTQSRAKDKQKANKNAQNAQKSAKTADSTAKTAKTADNTARAAKTAKTADTAAKTAKTAKAASNTKLFALLGNPITWYIIGGIIALMILIGMISYITTMPQLVWSKISNVVVEAWQNFLLSITNDPQHSVSDEDIKSVAQSLKNMGYDLEGCGFVEKVEYSGEDKREITSVTSKYLKKYIGASNRAYLIGPSSGASPNQGGMLCVDSSDAYIYHTVPTGIFSQIENLIDIIAGKKAINIDRKQQKMFISKIPSSNVTTVDLKEWSAKYGTPLELLLALHIGSMAPDFALDIAEVETELYFRIYDKQMKLKIEYDDGKNKIEDVTKIVANTPEGDYTINGEIVITKEQLDIVKKMETDFTVYIPYITSVDNHWFKDIVFISKDIELNTYNVTEPKEEYIDLDVGPVSAENGFTAIATSSKLLQVNAPYYVFKEPYIMKLINENKYTMYDGTVKDISERPEAYITPVKALLTAATLLEGTESEEAEYCLRDIRELLTYYQYDIGKDKPYVITDEGEQDVDALKTLYEERVRGYMNEDKNSILTESGPDNPPHPYTDFLCDRLKKQLLEGGGTEIVARTTGQTGFSENENVQAIDNGIILSVSNDSVVIKLENNTTMYISNIKVNENLVEGETVHFGDSLGSTTLENIKVIVKDSNHKIVNATEYVDLELLIA